jgi:hypothetical protein
MDYLLLHIWPFMAAAAALGLIAGIIAETIAARAARRRAEAVPRVPR